ncbi:PRC-barrel domain-containing protein [Tranquillimonas alkanivorans]|uniref:PRC-barrel domain-containing protein n=1 Tax=Tranquillimonas alkanivorans TaxID=441119 RepID=A0A1I5NZR0_9RHOB|nr:PRC-barrel domain-containing protein [Tranquillimonas alkanivorans]SFP27243.1 PRC-barrel domain-containing protein [Tranquillimonas alkanivorans]
MQTHLKLGLAAALAAATPAAAQDEGATPSLMRASLLLDGTIYAPGESQTEDWTVGEDLLAMPADWEEVGEIEDVALSTDGTIAGIVADVGGFLGIGENTILLPIEDLRAVRVAGEFYYITRLTEEQLEELPEVDESTWQ